MGDVAPQIAIHGSKEPAGTRQTNNVDMQSETDALETYRIANTTAFSVPIMWANARRTAAIWSVAVG